MTIVLLICTAPATAQLAPVLGREPPRPSATAPPAPPDPAAAAGRAVGLVDRYAPPPDVADPIVAHLQSAPTGPGAVDPETGNTTRNASELAGYLEQAVFGDPAGDLDGDGRRATTPLERYGRDESASIGENTTRTATNLTGAGGPGDVEENATAYAGYVAAGIQSGGDFDGDGNGTDDARSQAERAAEADAASLDDNASRVAGNASEAVQRDLEATTSGGAAGWATNSSPIDAFVENVTGTNLVQDLQDGDTSHVTDNATWIAEQLGAWAGDLPGWAIGIAADALRTGRVTARLVEDLDDGPEIDAVRLDPDPLVQGQEATVRARIQDPNTVAGAQVRWRLANGTVQFRKMSREEGSTWAADLTVRSPGTSTIAYRIVAWDDAAAGDAPDRDPRIDQGTFHNATGEDAPGQNRSKIHKAQVADRTPPRVVVPSRTLPAIPWQLAVHIVDPVGDGPVRVEVEIPRPDGPIRRSAEGHGPVHRVPIPALPPGDHDVRIDATDAAGNRRTVRTEITVVELTPALPLPVGDLAAPGPEPGADTPGDGTADGASEADTTRPDGGEETGSASPPGTGGGEAAALPGPGALTAVAAVGVAWAVSGRW